MKYAFITEQDWNNWELSLLSPGLVLALIVALAVGVVVVAFWLVAMKSADMRAQEQAEDEQPSNHD